MNAQTVELPEDSARKLFEDIENLNFKLDRLQRDNDSLIKFNEQLVRNNYQLNNKLQASRFKEDLFGAVLSEQTMRFGLFILLIVSVGTGFTIYAFRDRTKELKKQVFQGVDDISKNYSRSNQKRQELEKKLFQSLATVNYNLHRQNAENGNYASSVYFGLLSSELAYKSILENNEDDKQEFNDNSGVVIQLISLLNQCKTYIDLLPKTEANIKSIKSYFPEMMDATSIFAKSPSPQLRENAVQIRSKLIEIEKM
ncbi:MAG: hypothetical protein Kapaf2KO_16790 [Candidatus Kapaibacteriales bacterium]